MKQTCNKSVTKSSLFIQNRPRTYQNDSLSRAPAPQSAPLCPEKTLIKTSRRGSGENSASCTRRCSDCTQPWHHRQLRFFWKHEAAAAIIGSWRVLTRETQQNKYVNKDVFWIPKGEGTGLHLSLFKNDYPVTIPPKLKWSFFSLKVNKWQEWDLQPGFSVSQFSSTNH